MKQLFLIFLLILTFGCGKIENLDTAPGPGRSPGAYSTRALEPGELTTLGNVCDALEDRDSKFRRVQDNTYSYNFIPTTQNCTTGERSDLDVVNASVVGGQTAAGPFYSSTSNDIFSDIILTDRDPMDYPCSPDFNGIESYAGKNKKKRYSIKIGREDADYRVYIWEYRFSRESGEFTPSKKTEFLVEGSKGSSNYGVVKFRDEYNESCPGGKTGYLGVTLAK